MKFVDSTAIRLRLKAILHVLMSYIFFKLFQMPNSCTAFSYLLNAKFTLFFFKFIYFHSNCTYIKEENSNVFNLYCLQSI